MKTMNSLRQRAKTVPAKAPIKKDSIFKRFWKTKSLLAMFLPCLIIYILFKYVPMWGLVISLYDYKIFSGLQGSTFIGLDNFRRFFNSPELMKLTWNTMALGLQSLLIAFPLPILFALLLNEIRHEKFKKLVQTVSYMPHFLSVVIICGMVTNLLDPVTGGINQLIKLFGGEPIHFLIKKEWFRPVYLLSEIWAGLGWGSIMYLAAISNVDPTLYEAARLDGAGRWRQMWSITLPAIMPTVITMMILKVGNIMDASMEKVLLLQQPITYDTSQIISTYVYQQGISSGKYGYSTAIGLYSNVINLVLLFVANYVSKKVSDYGIF